LNLDESDEPRVNSENEFLPLWHFRFNIADSEKEDSRYI